MRVKRTQMVSVLFAVLFALSLVACKGESEDVNQAQETQNEEQQGGEELTQSEQKDQDVIEIEVEKIPENQNLLTGLADLTDAAIGKRPVAVMVNNVNASLPQYGIAGADVVFEMQVEGDLTRLMAVYADYTKIPKVCSVRSCRYYFPAVAHGFDAFYVNWGFDETIRSYVDGLGIPYLDGKSNPGGMFGRDQNRLNSGYALEHTAYFDGTKLGSYLDNSNYRTELLDGKKGTAFLFNGMNEQLKPEGNDCVKVNVEFGAATATFDYDEATNTYFKKINGKKQMDSVVGEQLSFTNVFVLEAKVGMRSDGYHKSIEVENVSNATGYYVSNGAVQKIKWSKDSAADYLKFYDESGNELSINRGKSYIAFNYAGQATFE